MATEQEIEKKFQELADMCASHDDIQFIGILQLGIGHTYSVIYDPAYASAPLWCIHALLKGLDLCPSTTTHYIPNTKNG
jgi:hypothetical protein